MPSRAPGNRRQLRNVASPGRKDLDWWLKLAPVVTICGTAIWTITLFFGFQRDQEQLKTRQMELSNEQLRLANAQLESASATELELKKVALEQAQHPRASRWRR